MDEVISIREIMEILPHQYPFLLIDRVLRIEPNNNIRGIKNITFNEPYFSGHFPGMPIMPGVLIVESMVQLGAILAAKTSGMTKQTHILYLSSVQNAKFRKIVSPGDVMVIDVKINKTRQNFWSFSGQVSVMETIVAESSFTAFANKINNGQQYDEGTE